MTKSVFYRVGSEEIFYEDKLVVKVYYVTRPGRVMIVEKEYIGGNRWFLDFFYYALLYGRVVAPSCIKKSGLLRKYERLLWVKYTGYFFVHTRVIIFWENTYLNTELQRKKIGLLRTRKGLVTLDLRVYTTVQDSFFQRSKNLRYLLKAGNTIQANRSPPPRQRHRV